MICDEPFIKIKKILLIIYYELKIEIQVDDFCILKKFKVLHGHTHKTKCYINVKYRFTESSQ